MTDPGEKLLLNIIAAISPQIDVSKFANDALTYANFLKFETEADKEFYMKNLHKVLEGAKLFAENIKKIDGF